MNSRYPLVSKILKLANFAPVYVINNPLFKLFTNHRLGEIKIRNKIEIFHAKFYAEENFPDQNKHST